MNLQPITPQPPAFVAWEDALTDAVGEALEACRSDAQAIVEAQAETVARAWRSNLNVLDAAALVIEAAMPCDDAQGAQA